LGLPVTDELLLPNGMKQQSFEGGAIQFNPATGIAVLRPAVNLVALTPSGSVHMKVGDTLAAQVVVTGIDGTVFTDRTVTWNSSNGRVVQIVATGLTASIKAVGGGTAIVTATSEGKTSAQLTIFAAAPCCQIGEGAPTASIQQAFQDAVTRNKLGVLLPAASAVSRVGAGYAQQLTSTSTPPVPYLVTVADGSVTGYVVAGAILSLYLPLGGPAGSLGFPVSDATAGGRQMFQQGALAGNPVQLVSGAILSKWGGLGFETGVAGPPVGAAAGFQTFRGTAGSVQSFQNALIIAPATGPLAGQTFFVSGLILAQYNSAAGLNGDLGAPAADEHEASGLHQQDFEGGYINYASSDSVASVFTTPRQPLVTATPGAVLSGTPVHLVVGGFDNGTKVRVSQTGQPDFVITVSNGSYAWDVLVPATAASGVVTIRAVDLDTAATGQGSYSIRSAASAPLTVSIVSGDLQNGAPGAQLGQPLVVVVQDQSGNPIAGQTVTFTASPGAQVAPASTLTLANGQASAKLRLPMSEGDALVTAEAGHQVVTFGAKAAAFSLTGFPVLSQATGGVLGQGSDLIRQKGALLTAVASSLRYHQSRNELPQPNGFADPGTLNQFLKSLCTVDSQGNQVCDGFVSSPPGAEQTVNLWRVGAFVGNLIDVHIEQADLNSVRDLVAAGSPVLLALSLNGLGSHFVVATGIARDGGLVIADSGFAQTNLKSYINGFSSSAGTIQGTLSGAVRLVPGRSSSAAFLVENSAPVSISSVAGACGQPLQFPAVAANTASGPPAAAIGTLYSQTCDGSSGPYQLDIAAQGAYTGTFTDLSPNGSRTALTGSGASSSEILHSAATWNLAPVTVSISAPGVVNAASFTNAIAPGSLAFVYGAGFVGAGSSTSVQIDGEDATVLAAFPFQLSVQVPFDIPPGTATLKVVSENGSAQQPIIISDVAPAIFSTGPSQAAITNLDNILNAPSNPAIRGNSIMISATGLGAVSPLDGLTAATLVSVVIGGVEVPASAGLTPEAVGLYQVSLQIPFDLPPGLNLPLYLKQGAAISNIVSVAIQ
jgi:uncharacterized protein (TIGR03437 family)